MILRSLRSVGLAGCLTAVALGFGCAGPEKWWQQDLRAWQGAPVSEVLDAWGPPLRTLTSEGEATTLVFERTRELDYRLEELEDPGARLDPNRHRHGHSRVDRSDCTVYFKVAAEHVVAVRHEGAVCDVVPRDPARRRVDPSPGRRR